MQKLGYDREGESEKHLGDISGILAFSADEIDFKMLEAQIEKRGLKKQWAAAKNYKVQTLATGLIASQSPVLLTFYYKQ